MNNFGIPLEQLLSLDTLWSLLKVLYMIAFGLYVIFSIVVLSQIRQMTATLKGQLELPLKMFGVLHCVLALLSFLAGLIIL